MNIFIGKAPGKVILFGEHAVVYGHPAIAVPVTRVCASVKMSLNSEMVAGGITFDSPAMNLKTDNFHINPDHPLLVIMKNLDDFFNHPALPGIQVEIDSDIPVSAGMGSGAAISVALIKAYAKMVGETISTEDISSLAFEIEKVYHGTPSGIDNTVITYEKPVYYQRGQPIVSLKLAVPFRLIIADTGIKKETARVVAQVQKNWSADPEKYEHIFSEIGQTAMQARYALETGLLSQIGSLMNKNQQLLSLLDVSRPEIDILIKTALDFGASGAKLSGAGQGGNIIIFPGDEDEARIVEKLLDAGAVRAICTTIKNPEDLVK